VPVLGNKGQPCFIYSALYDDDEEFLRRYGEPSRARWMLAHYATEPTATTARTRLQLLLNLPVS
jgi:hypothetical protein